MNKNRGFKLVKDWKPVKGMTVYVVPDDGRDKPSVGEIDSIGRKYFSVKVDAQTLKFDLDYKNKSEWPAAVCYQSEERYRESIELYQKIQTIQNEAHRLTPDQINTIFNWITENNKEK